jgi:diguanylate cyclase (GGDEF)-like protein/excisionase family DNA binding protein
MRVGRANGEDWLRLSEAADALGVSLNTVRRWSDSGKVTSYRSPGGHRRYRRRDVESLLLRQRGDLATVGVMRALPPSGDHSTADIERLRTPLTALAQVAAEGIGVTSCLFALVTGDTTVHIVADHRPLGAARYVAADVDLPLERAPAISEVLRTGRRLVIADLGSTNLLARSEADAYRKFGDLSLLALPLNVNGRFAGVMELAETRSARTFTGANIAFAEFMARQASRLLGEEHQGSTDVEPRDQGIVVAPPVDAHPAAAPHRGSADGRGMLHALVERLRGELDAAACDVLRYDPVERALTLVSAAAEGKAPPLEGLLYPVGDLDGVAAVLEGGESVTLADLGDGLLGSHLVRYEENGARSILCVPLHLGDDVLGLLEVFSADPHHGFERKQLGLVEAAAAMAALMLADAESSTGLARRLGQLDELMADLTDRSSTSDAESVVRAALKSLREDNGLTACTLYTVEDGVATAAETTGITAPPDTTSWRLEEYPAAAAAVAGRRTLVAMASDDSQFTPAAATRFLTSRGLSGVVLTPLVFWGRLVGLLEVGAPQADVLTTVAQIVEMTAGLLAATLGGGDVITGLQRRNRVLMLVVEAGLEDTARLSTDEVLHAVVERLAELTHSPVADIYAVEGNTLRALVSYDNGQFDDEWEGVAIPLPRYPCSRRAIDTGDIVVAASLDDPLLSAEGRHSLEKWGYQSQLSMPLVSGGRVLGLVELSDYAARDFAAELELIRGLGQVAAHALENAALFEQVERRSRALNELVDLGALTSGTHDLDALLRHAAERLLAAVDAANCDIFRACDEGMRCVASFDRSGCDESSVGDVLDLDAYPTVWNAANNLQVLVVTSPDDPQLSEGERRTYREFGFASEVCVPLVIDGELCGLIDIYDTQERDYAEFLGFLKGAGQTLAGAFENAQLFRQIERRSGVLREIVELGAVASQSHDLQKILTVLAERLRDTVEAADCDIFTLQGDQLRCLVSADQDGLDENVVGNLLDIDRFPATAMAVRSGEVMAVASLDDPRLTDEERTDMGEYGYQSELCIPLVIGERVIGLVDVFDTRPRDFAEYLDFLRSVGQTAAGAIENALLVADLERRNTALAELVELGRVVSGTGGLRRLIRTLGPRVVDVVGAFGCQVFAVKDDSLDCLLTYENGAYEDTFVTGPLALSLFPSSGEALATGKPLVISSPDDPRLGDYERRMYAESGSRSAVVVPLAVDDRTVGLLEVYDQRERDYAENLAFLISVGHLIAGAFENASLFERLEATNQTLSLLVDSGLEFGATLELGEVLQSVAQRLCAATAAPNCDISIVDGGELRCIACIDHGEPDDDFVGTVHSLTGMDLIRQSLADLRPIHVSDLATDERLSDYERHEDMQWGHRAMLELPLVNRGQVIGIASMFDDHPREFEQLELLQSLAQVAANALANATLFEQLDRSADRLALVSDVSFELSSSLDLGEVLLSTAHRLCAVADTPMCDIYTLGDDGRLVNVVSLEDGEVDQSWLGREFPLADWAAVEKAVRTRQPVVVESRDDPILLADERALMESFGETAALLMPLISKERVIGVLELTEKRGPRAFTQEEIDTAASVCRVAALAIDNADLVEDLRVRSRENELLNDIARATGASLDLGTIAAGAVEKLRELVPFDRALLALLRGDDALDVVYASSPRLEPVPDTVTLPPVTEFLERLRSEAVMSLRLPDDVPEEFALPGLGDLGAAVLIALTNGDELMGALALGTVLPDAFAHVDRRLLERTGTHLALAINNAGLYENIKTMHLSNLKALSSALNAKDYYTLGHAARVAGYMVLLGKELGWATDLIRHVEEAAYLHDIGKIGVSDRVLLKPGGLNTHEWELMRQHPIFSADIIRPLFDEPFVLGVRHHHERFDGGGYPDGLHETQIPIIARAMCIADSYDAMSFRRPYRQALDYAESVAELRRCSGSQFDPEIVEAFVRVLEQLARDREFAASVAREAAARIDPEEHALLRSREDEGLSEYGRINATLRAVCAEHPPTRFITSSVRHGRKTVVVCDSGEGADGRPHIGHDIMTDDELLEVFAGGVLDINVLFADQWGVWVSGVAPLTDSEGEIVAVVAADIPATEGITEVEGVESNVAQTLASMLDSSAEQAGRSEIDAITDALTGLYNHCYFHERLSEELDRCQEQGGELSLLFCDLDNFRAFNERHGHGAGDRAIRAAARIVEDSVRHVDLAARFGGEEFAAILIDTGEQGALEVAERIRAGIIEARFSAGADPLSVSIGVASCPADATFKEELIDKADWAMYLAKRRGRNRVLTFSAEHGSDTPERAAAMNPDYVGAMSELAAARTEYTQRRRSAIIHLALAVGRALGLDAAELHTVARAAGQAMPPGPSSEGHKDEAHKVVALATAYQAMVADRPYRPQVSEAEALAELLACPALLHDRAIAEAFSGVLSQP